MEDDVEQGYKVCLHGRRKSKLSRVDTKLIDVAVPIIINVLAPKKSQAYIQGHSSVVRGLQRSQPVH